MNELTNAGSGPASATSEPGAASPPAPATPLTSAQTWEKLETDAAAPPDGAPPEAPAFEFPGEETPETPQAEEPLEGEPPKPEEPEKTPEQEAAEKAAQAEKWREYTPLERLTPEQKAFFNANPGLRDTVFAAVRRDAVFHEAGFTPDFAEGLAQAGLTTPDRVGQAMQAVRDVDALDADFQAGTPDAVLQMAATLSQLYPEATAKFIENITSPQVLLQASPQTFFKLRSQLLSDLFTNTQRQVKDLLENDPDAVAQVDGFMSLLDDLSKRIGTTGHGGGGVDPATQVKLEELDALKYERAQGFRAQASREIDAGVKALIFGEIDKAAPKGFDPTIRSDLGEKIVKQVFQQLLSDPFFLRGRDAILGDRSRSPEERRAALVAFFLKSAGPTVNKAAKRVVGPYTHNAINVNKQTHQQRRSLASNREIGGSRAAGPAVPTFDKNMSDADKWNFLEAKGARRGG